MSRRLVCIVSVFAALALAVLLVVRQRTLSDLRAGNESLRRQIETRSSSAVSEPAAGFSSTSPAAPLSAQEKSELLRLRGQISSLRREAGEASNRVAGLRRTASKSEASRSSSPEPAARIDQMHAFMRSEPYRMADDFSKAMQRYVREHGGQLPDDPGLLVSADDSPLPEATLRRFELVRTGALSASDGPLILVAREKEGRQLPDGTWVRLYVQANGGLTIAGSATRPAADDSAFLRATEESSRKEAARMQQEHPESRQ